MKLELNPRTWKWCMRSTICVLGLLIIFNFYGLYTNKFYLLKPDNYIFPLLTLVHFTFLYVMSFKIREGEYTDAPMRNLEYSLYVISTVYIFKIVDTFYILMSYNDYVSHVIPETFLPLGVFILALQLLLIALTLLTFMYRREMVGTYNFDNINENIDPWP